MLRLTDLREILHYVPHFRDKVFVIALDGAVIADDNFGNLLRDVAILRSLRIGVVLVHGAGWQVQKLAEATGQTPSNVDGTGVTDAPTLELARTAANRVTHEILQGLTAVDLRAACGNALVAHPAGILGGVDHQFTGRVERVDVGLLQALLERDIVPVVPPLGIDGEGTTYRLNSDAAAVEVALALKAVKLIYLTADVGIQHDGQLLRQLPVGDAEQFLKRPGEELSAPARSKLSQAVRAANGGVPRIHIIDGRVQEGLLAEVFSNEGIGTLVHANDYQAIRRAVRRDARAIFSLTRGAVETEELAQRSRGDVERQIEDYYVFEVDRSIVACMAIHFYPESKQAELAHVYVDSRYENQGIGTRMMQYAENVARGRGAAEVFCLSTQAFNYFVQKGGFRHGTPDDLPPARRARYDKSGRRSQVLVKRFDGAPAS